MTLYWKESDSHHCEIRVRDGSWLEELDLLFSLHHTYPTTLPPHWNSVPDREFSVGMPMILHQCWVTLSSIAIHFVLVEEKILSSLFLCLVAPIPTLWGVFTCFRLDMPSVPWQTEADVSLPVLHLPENRAGTSLTGCQKKASREQKLLNAADFGLTITKENRN